MLNKLASVFGLTAFFMLQSITALSDYARANIKQFAPIAGADNGSPFIGAIVDPKFFFAIIFTLICFTAACLATKFIFALGEIAYWCINHGVNYAHTRMTNLYQAIKKPK